MNILVTGAAGFIGSHVSKALIDRGDYIVAIDNFNDYYDPKIKEDRIISLNLSENTNFSLHRMDITDFDRLKKVFDSEEKKGHKIEKICHLAARAGAEPSINNPFIYEETNMKGTLNLLELAKQLGIKHFVFASSSSVYGKNTEMPFREDHDTSTPLSPYAATKKAGEALCHSYNHLFGIGINCLRFFTVYGPWGRPDMVLFKFTKNISEGKAIQQHGDGSARRDFTFITDIVAGVLAAIDKSFGFEVFNIANSNPEELKSMIKMIENELDKKADINVVDIPKEEVPVTFADISKARKLLGFEPKVNLQEGIREFVKWYLEYHPNEET